MLLRKLLWQTDMLSNVNQCQLLRFQASMRDLSSMLFLFILLLTYLRTGLRSRRLIALGNGVYYHQDNELYGNEKL